MPRKNMTLPRFVFPQIAQRPASSPAAAPSMVTTRYRSLRSLCARLAALNFEIEKVRAQTTQKGRPQAKAPGERNCLRHCARAEADGAIEGVGVHSCTSFQNETPPSGRIVSAANGSPLCPRLLRLSQLARPAGLGSITSCTSSRADAQRCKP